MNPSPITRLKFAFFDTREAIWQQYTSTNTSTNYIFFSNWTIKNPITNLIRQRKPIKNILWLRRMLLTLLLMICLYMIHILYLLLLRTPSNYSVPPGIFYLIEKKKRVFSWYLLSFFLSRTLLSCNNSSICVFSSHFTLFCVSLVRFFISARSIIVD